MKDTFITDLLFLLYYSIEKGLVGLPGTKKNKEGKQEKGNHWSERCLITAVIQGTVLSLFLSKSSIPFVLLSLVLLFVLVLPSYFLYSKNHFRMKHNEM